MHALHDFLPASEGGIDAFGLTPRERGVLDLLARGLDNQAIGGELGISEKTVRNHVTAIFDKLGATTRAQAIVAAREVGLGTSSGPPGTEVPAGNRRTGR